MICIYVQQVSLVSQFEFFCMMIFNDASVIRLLQLLNDCSSAMLLVTALYSH